MWGLGFDAGFRVSQIGWEGPRGRSQGTVTDESGLESDYPLLNMPYVRGGPKGRGLGRVKQGHARRGKRWSDREPDFAAAEAQRHMTASSSLLDCLEEEPVKGVGVGLLVH